MNDNDNVNDNDDGNSTLYTKKSAGHVPRFFV